MSHLENSRDKGEKADVKTVRISLGMELSDIPDGQVCELCNTPLVIRQTVYHAGNNIRVEAEGPSYYCPEDDITWLSAEVSARFLPLARDTMRRYGYVDDTNAMGSDADIERYIQSLNR